MSIDRRQFIQWLAAAGLLATQPAVGWQTAPLRRAIPSSGERLPIVGMGTWLTFGIDPHNRAAFEQRLQVMKTFFELGGGMIDSSPMYGSAEQVLGLCLKALSVAPGLFAATKVWTHGDREGMLQMEQSRLYWGLPRFDLMQVHNLLDWQTHLPRLRAMKDAGAIRYVGVTTSHGRRHQELIRILQNESLDFVQLTYNMLDREAEQRLLPLARDKGVAVIVNRPFQRGGLFDYVGRHPLPDWAADIDCAHWSQFFLKFVLSHPAVTCAIPATSRPDHLRENMAAASAPLPDEEQRRKMLAYLQSL